MAPRLKTFVTSDGFTEYVVAASSRPKALAAWGVKQDLFAEGRAHETDDPALVKASQADPGTVVERRAPGLKPPKFARPARNAPTAAARHRVADLERRLQALRAAHAETQDALDVERQALEIKAEQASAQYDKEKVALDGKLAAARKRLA